MSRPTVMEEVFEAVRRVAPELKLYVAYCDEPEHKDFPQLSSSPTRFCSMCGAPLTGTVYQPDRLAVEAEAPAAQKKGEAA